MREDARVCGWIALLFAVTAGIWCFTIPIGEAPDEREHLQYAQFIRDQGRLPAREDLNREAMPEAFQPPLYHAILAGLSAGIGFDPGRIIWVKNPVFDRTSFPRRANEFDHAAMRALNSAPDMAKFRFMRLPNVLFGALLIWILLRTVSILGGIGPGGVLVVAAASTPLLAFTSGTIGNDLLAALFGALGIYALVRARVSGESRWMWIAAASLALGLLVKMTVLFLWVGLLVMVFWTAPRWKPIRDRIILALLPLPAAVWTVSRTLHLQERNQETSNAGVWLASYAATAVKTLYHCASTAVGVVGVHSIWLPGFVYGVFFAIAAVVLIHWLQTAKFSDPLQQLSLAGWLASMLLFVVAVYWYRDSGFSMHSRLFLPFIPAMLLGPALAWPSAEPVMINAGIRRPSLIAGLALLLVSFLPAGVWLGFADSVRSALSLVKPPEHYAAILSLLVSAFGAFLIVLIAGRSYLPLLTGRVQAKPSALLWFALVGFGANLLILFSHVRFFFA